MAKNEKATVAHLVPHCGTTWGLGGVLVLAFVAALGLLLRCAYLLQTDQVPFVWHLVGDAAAYWEWARRISSGDWLGSSSFYQAPLYPYLLAIAIKCFGESVSAVRLTQSALTAAAIALLGWGTGKLFGRWAGVLAATMYAVYAPSLFLDGIVQKESTAASLVCILYALIVAMSCSATFARAITLGFVLGLLSLIRENTQLWIPIVLLWVWRQKAVQGAAGSVYGLNGPSNLVGKGKAGFRGTDLTLPLATVLGCSLVLGPVAIRNRIVGGEWSISTFQAGPNFYIGNGAEADGRYRPLVRGHETPAFERGDATLLAEQAMGRSLTPREVSRYWLRRGWIEAMNAPSRWIGLLGCKFAMIFNDYEVTDGESQYVYADYSSILSVLQSVGRLGVLFPISVIGLWATWSRRRELWIHYALLVSFAGSVAAFYVLARYRFPLVPLLIPFAAAGLVEMYRMIRAHKWREVGIAAIIGIAAAVFSFWPVHDRGRLDALARMNVGVALAQTGDIPKAAKWFEAAVMGHPTSAEANLNLAQALAVMGRFEEAIPHYERALSVEPKLPGAKYNLAVAFEQVGRVDEALGAYQQALVQDPKDGEARAAVLRLQASTERLP